MRLLRRLSIFALFSVLTIGGQAQPYPQWGALQAGPYKVGFRVIHTYDYTRGYWPKVDYQGRVDTLETARPMQISLWYPAVAPADDAPMVFGDYIALKASARGLPRTTEADRREAVEALRRGPLNPFFPEGVSDEDLQRVLQTPTAAIQEADAAAGTFPLVIHTGFSLSGQSVLLEYLASHGYVVAAVPLLGTHPAWYHRGEGTAEAYQAGADDIGFIYSQAQHWPLADVSKTAVIGMFSAQGLLFQMQQMQLDALAVLDGNYPEALYEVPGFDFTAVRIPILDMPRANFRGERSMLDSLRYADRYLARFDGVTHGDFYQFQRIAHPEQAEEHVSYHLIARYTRAFLDMTLKQDASAVAFLAKSPDEAGAPEGMMTLAHHPAHAARPTEAEFLALIRAGQASEARRAWERAAAASPRPIASESALTTTLFFFRRDNGAQVAVPGFELLTDLFPTSWRAWEHLGTTYWQAQDVPRARTAFQQALHLLGQEDTPEPRHKERLQKRLDDLQE